MAFSDNSRQSLIPNFLYSSSSTTSLLMGKSINHSNPSLFPSPSPPKEQQNFMIASPSEPFGKIEMYSPRFYAACTVGGILSCGLTHMTVTPLDLVKCNMQVYVFNFECLIDFCSNSTHVSSFLWFSAIWCLLYSDSTIYFLSICFVIISSLSFGSLTSSKSVIRFWRVFKLDLCNSLVLRLVNNLISFLFSLMRWLRCITLNGLTFEIRCKME